MSVRSPFVKWAGGKRRLLPFIAEHLSLDAPDESARRIVEPFAGGAAVSLAFADGFDALWLNDRNADLMAIYRRLQDDPERYIRAAAALFSPATNESDTYYRLREQFNGAACADERATIFLYLNRHGYNGLSRYNRSGGFNVPYGRYKNPYFPEDELRAAAGVMQKTRLTELDFEEVMAACGAGDIVYCDPPYVPLSDTASFTDYAAGGFGLKDQQRLVAAAKAAQGRGALVAISNHDTEVTRGLYDGAECHFQRVRRTISCDGNNRNEVREVLALFRPEGFAARTAAGAGGDEAASFA